MGWRIVHFSFAYSYAGAAKVDLYMWMLNWICKTFLVRGRRKESEEKCIAQLETINKIKTISHCEAFIDLMYLCHTSRKYTMCATVCGCGSSLCWALTVYPKGLFCFLVSFPPSARSWKECRRTGPQRCGIPFCSGEALIHMGAEVTQGELNVPPWFLLTELITDKELDSPGLLLAQRCATFGVMCWSYMQQMETSEKSRFFREFYPRSRN